MVQGDRRYRDAVQPATAAPGRVPAALQDFARQSVAAALRAPQAVERVLGEWLSDPKPEVWFTPGQAAAGAIGIDRRSRLLYDDGCIYFNGESFRAAGRDAGLLRKLADEGRLAGTDRARFSAAAAALVDDWLRAGWLRALDTGDR